MFSGNQSYKVDTQGRLPIPPRWRSSFAGVVKVTHGEDKRCLYVYTAPDWERRGSSINNRDDSPDKAKAMYRFFGFTEELDIDKQGRVQLPQDYRTYAHLSTDAVVVGMLDHLEIWSPDGWRELVEGLEPEDSKEAGEEEEEPP